MLALVNNKKYIQQELDALYQEERFLKDRQEEIWKYHPDNPERIDIETDYNYINTQMDDVKYKIGRLEGEQA